MVTAVVLRDTAVMVMVMVMVTVAGDRGAGVEHPGGADCDGAGSERNGTDRHDAISRSGQHGLSFPRPDLVMRHVLKLEIERSRAGLSACQSPGGAAPTTTVVASAPATMQAISR